MEENVKNAEMEDELVRVLQGVFTERLLSVMLYGSYVGGNYVPKLSDINVLVVLEKTLPEDLEKLGKVAFRFLKKHKITPLIVSRVEFERSSDVFPMEYMDIRSRCRVVFGSDETEPLTLTSRNLRHQLEHLLRGNIISLRQLLIASRGKKKALRNSIKNWYGSMNALFRGLIRLKAETPSEVDADANIKKVQDLYNVDTIPFRNLIAFRSGEPQDPGDLISSLLGCLEKLIRVVDSLDDEQ